MPGTTKMPPEKDPWHGQQGMSSFGTSIYPDDQHTGTQGSAKTQISVLLHGLSEGHGLAFDQITVYPQPRPRGRGSLTISKGCSLHTLH